LHNLEPYDDFDENNPDEEFDADDSGNYPHPRGDIHLMRPTLREATNALTVRQPIVWKNYDPYLHYGTERVVTETDSRKRHQGTH
jgi:hypothetical protein